MKGHGVPNGGRGLPDSHLFFDPFTPMRVSLRFILALSLAISLSPIVLAQGNPQGQGRMGGGEGRGEAHNTIHALLSDHAAIERRVEDIPNGVKTWTTSEDEDVAILIRQHVRQMKARLESGRPMRRWDPLFAAVFEHADAIEMTIEDIPGGVYVVETSDDPEAVALIRQHAHRAVSEFVERGMDRAHEPTPLPEQGDGN